MIRILFFAILSFSFAEAQTHQAFDPNYRGGYFDQANEFQNYFLPERYRNSSSVPPEVVQKAKANLQETVQSIFQRLAVPIATDGPEKVKMVRYFGYLSKEIKAIDKAADLMPSGGVTRSVIGYVYQEIYEGMSQRPPISPEQTMARLKGSKESIPAYKIRGVGSDFDVLVRSPGGKSKEISEHVTKITNSAESKFGATEMTGDAKKSLFTVGDVKEYTEQITRATSQGGADTDFLAFDTKRGKFVEPPGLEGIVDSLVQGKFRYLAPLGAEKVEDAAKQTVRGMRPLVELPFLRIENENQFRKELQDLITQVKNGELPSDKALTQFDKMVRNARQSGAHNRFYRGAPGSIEELIHETARAIESATNRATIPEFVDRVRVDSRSLDKKELNGLPKALLTSNDDFIKKFTKDGKLYHGTPNIDNGMAIMRGGIFISKDKGLINNGERTGTAAVFGRGGYTSPDPSVSHSYAGSEGVVFELKVNQDPRLNILNWQEVKDSPVIKELEKKAVAQERDVFEVLARDHGIDVIIHDHVLLQNMEAVEVPKDIKGLTDALGTIIDRPGSSLTVKLQAQREHSVYYRYAQALGEKDIKAPVPFEKIMKSAIKDARPEKALKNLKEFADSENLKEFLAEHPSYRSRVRSLIQRNIKENVALAAEFPWDLANLEDRKVLNSIISQLPEDFNVIYTRSEIAKNKAIQSNPRYSRLNQRSEFNWDNFDPKKIKNPSLRAQLQTALYQERAMDKILFISNNLYKQNPKAYFDWLGDRPIPGFTHIKLSDATTGKTLNQIRMGSSEFSDDVDKIIKKVIVSGDVKNLTDSEKKLFNEIIRRGDPHLVQWILTKQPKTSDFILDVLKKTDPKRVAEIMASNFGYGEQGPELKSKTNDIFQAAFKKDPQWRTAVYNGAARGLGLEELKTFPWDLKNPEDQKMIKGFLKDREDKFENFEKAKKTLAQTEGVKIYTVSDSYVAHNLAALPDSAAKKNFEEAWRSALLSDMAEALTKKTEMSPAIDKGPKSPFEDKYKIYDFIAKWDSTSKANLSKDDLVRIKYLEEHFPINEQNKEIYESIFRKGKNSREWAIDRMSRLNDKELAVAMSSLKVNSEIEKIPSWPKAKEAMRDLVQRQPKLVSNFPVNASDAKDIQMLKDLVKSNPKGDRVLMSEADVTLRELRKKYPSADLRNYVTNIRANDLPEDPLSKKFLHQQQRLEARASIDRVLDSVFVSRPDVYVRNFDNETRTFSSQFSGHDMTRLEGKPDYVKSLMEKVKVGSVEPLTDIDIKVIKAILRKSGDDHFIAYLVSGRNEVRKIALDYFKSSGDIHQVFQIVDAYRGGDPDYIVTAQKVLTEQIRSNKEFRKAMRDQILINSYNFNTFPWDMTNADDVEALKKALDTKKIENSRRVLNNLMRQKGEDVAAIEAGKAGVDDLKLGEAHYRLKSRESRVEHIQEYLREQNIEVEKVLRRPAQEIADRQKILLIIREKLGTSGVCISK